MPARPAVFTAETFGFFRDLAQNNRKDWMDANRDRYDTHVTRPFRELRERLAPHALKVHSSFDGAGKPGRNFSRINRDIRFAKDKTPYRPQMYLQFSSSKNGEGDDGQYYVGLNGETATVGFRIYGMTRKSTLGTIGVPRALQNQAWLVQLAKRLRRKYESYWYSSEKGEWTKNEGWPVKSDDWKRLKGWVVRRKIKRAAALVPAFEKETVSVFRDLAPLYGFTSLHAWKK